MDIETEEVLAPEIVLTENDSNNPNPVGTAVVTGLALVGAFKVGSWVKGKVSFQSPIVRKTKDAEITPIVPVAPTPVVAE